MKNIWESKTFWANVILAVLVIVQLALDQAWIPAEWQALVVVVVNMILRLISNTGISVPGFPKDT